MDSYQRGVQCANPACRHSKARHTGSRHVQGLRDADAGLHTACDEFGCPCGGFREDRRAQVISEFLDSWRFCPVSSAESKSKPTLLDAAMQLIAAIDESATTGDEEKAPTPVETSDAADVADPGERLYPQTAREALFEIRRRAAGVHVDLDVTDFGEAIDKVALEGLARTEPLNFELTDQLADRLAEAHKVLAEIRDKEVQIGGARDRELRVRVRTEIDEALALPPDFEAMIERRR